MPTFVALLRGVNVGTGHRVPMADLRRLLEALGHGDVVTMLNSGNAVFRASARDTKGIERAIHGTLVDRLEVDVPVIVKRAADLAASSPTGAVPAFPNPGGGMHPASTSMRAFSIYLFSIGAGLLFAPALLLGTLGLPAPQEIWVRVLGAVTLVLGSYYWVGAGSGLASIYRASVLGRAAFASLAVLLVVAYSGPPQLLLFAATDVAFATWTGLAMRRGAGH